MNAEEVREEILSWMNNIPQGEWEITSGAKGVMIAIINNAMRLDGGMTEANARRHEILAWLFRDVLNRPMANSVSTKELTKEMWWCLFKYIDPHKDPDTGVWAGKEGLSDDLYVCWRALEDWEIDMEAQMGKI